MIIDALCLEGIEVSVKKKKKKKQNKKQTTFDKLSKALWNFLLDRYVYK